MKRWHQDLKITKKQWRIHRNFHVESNLRRNKVGADPFEVDCACDDQVGRFRKVDAYDCGRKRCYLCHSDKYPRRDPTWQELAADMKFKEGLEELEEIMEERKRNGRE